MKQAKYYCEICKKSYKIPKDVPVSTYVDNHTKYHNENPGKELNPDTIHAEDRKILTATDTRDSLLQAAQQKWSDQAYLQDSYQLFLMSVQVGAPKDYRYKKDLDFILAGSPKWDESSTFEEFIQDNINHLRFSLDVLLVQKKKERKPILNVYRELITDPDVRFNPIIGQPTTMEHVEVYEFILRKSIEACNKFLAGKLQLISSPSEIQA